MEIYSYSSFKLGLWQQVRIIVMVMVALIARNDTLLGQSSRIDQSIDTPGKSSLWDLPEIPEQDINIGYWALVIARECDSTVDIDRYLHTLDTMAARIQYMVGPRDGDMVSFLMAKAYQFEPGQWNAGNVFSYDLDDPMGMEPRARLLTTYLESRKGNCVSMPTLFLALMERVDPTVPFHGVSAPLHLFCRLRDRQDGKVWNVESTSGGSPTRDQWYIESFGISQTAMDSGIYMRSLTKKEYVAELISVLVSLYRSSEKYEEALSFVDLILELNPRSVTGIVQKGAILGWQGHTLQKRIVEAEKRTPTAEEQSRLELYKIQSDSLINYARSLGWEPETPESREQYLRTVQEAKTGTSR